MRLRIGAAMVALLASTSLVPTRSAWADETARIADSGYKGKFYTYYLGDEVLADAARPGRRGTRRSALGWQRARHRRPPGRVREAVRPYLLRLAHRERDRYARRRDEAGRLVRSRARRRHAEWVEARDAARHLGDAGGRSPADPDAFHQRAGAGTCRTRFLVEQKLAIALAIFQRLYVRGHGRLVFEGTPAELAVDAGMRREWLEV